MSQVKQRTEAEVADIAKDRGLEYFLPLPNELFLDMDEPPYEVKESVWEFLLSGEHAPLEARPDPLFTISEHLHQHIYIRMVNTVTDLERILIQASLGSDPVKELLSLERYRLESEAITTLFETKEEAERVRAWRKTWS